MEELTLDELLAAIKSDDVQTRANAVMAAGPFSAKAIKPLAKIVDQGDLEVSRAAKRAIWKIVRCVGAPGVGKKRAIVNELVDLIATGQPDSVRREAFWMLSEIGSAETIDAIGEMPEILDDKEMREHARCCLERIPTEAAVKLLEAGLEEAPEDFKLAVAQSLRARGVEVSQEKYPCQKLLPTKQTKVRPVNK
jgi:HEAT repeat protein